jgi:hypothetical protein
MKEAETKAAIASEMERCASLQSRLQECEDLLKELILVEQRCKEQAKHEAADQEARSRDMATLEKKSMQYKQVASLNSATKIPRLQLNALLRLSLECQDIARLKEQLKRNGVTEKIYHTKILQESEAVMSLREQLQPLRASVEAFQGLPSDLRLAKQRVSSDPPIPTLSSPFAVLPRLCPAPSCVCAFFSQTWPPSLWSTIFWWSSFPCHKGSPLPCWM